MGSSMGGGGAANSGGGGGGDSYLEQFVDASVSTVLGLADGFTFGAYSQLTDALGLGTPTHDLAYDSGLFGSMFVSSGRLLYAGAASTIRYVPGITEAEAVASRNTLKEIFSTMGADHPCAYSVGAMLANYGSEEAVIRAASRTNFDINTAAMLESFGSVTQFAVGPVPQTVQTIIQ